jgi:hypothetical protein|tara:strand:- start:4 stop:492 length:489 start_codon:yes stop_codon:yes gene_type:complete
MAELLEPQDIMFTPFEPKLKNRFIMQIDGINAYLIKSMNRPSIESDEVILEHMNTTRYVKGKSRWQPLEIMLYDPVVPSAAQQVIEWIRLHHESVTGRDGYADFYKKNVTFNLLDPVGAVVEEWELKGAYIQSANFGDMDFASSDPVEISLTLRYDYAILKF